MMREFKQCKDKSDSECESKEGFHENENYDEMQIRVGSIFHVLRSTMVRKEQILNELLNDMTLLALENKNLKERIR